MIWWALWCVDPIGPYLYGPSGGVHTLPPLWLVTAGREAKKKCSAMHEQGGEVTNLRPEVCIRHVGVNAQ